MCELSKRQLLLVAFFSVYDQYFFYLFTCLFFSLKLDIFNVYCGKSGTQILPCPPDLLLLLIVVILVCLFSDFSKPLL